MIMETDVKNSRYYLNRELSWLQFNKRVLQEAVDTSNPLLEKLKFLAITSSNLDEFFMIRVAGLKHQKENGVKRRDIANMTPTEQLENISDACQKLVAQQYMHLKGILKELETEGLVFIKPADADVPRDSGDDYIPLCRKIQKIQSYPKARQFDTYLLFQDSFPVS